MNLVTTSDDAILKVARSIVRPSTAVFPEKGAVAPGLSTTGLRVFQNALSSGCLQQLMLRGGWRKGFTIDSKGVAFRGRLWERHRSLPPLRFTGASLELCRWIAAGAPKEDAPPAQPAGLGSGDELFIYLACNVPQSFPFSKSVYRCDLVRSSTLAWLGSVGDMALSEAKLPARGNIDKFSHGVRALIVEVLTKNLAWRWMSAEMGKGHAKDPVELQRLGERQAAVLELFLDAIESAKRWDLATFFVDAVHDVLQDEDGVQGVVRRYRGQLGGSGTLAQRQAAIQASASTLRLCSRLNRAYQDLRLVRHFDENYGSAQAIVRRWEHLGTSGFAKAASVVRELDGLDAAESVQ